MACVSRQQVIDGYPQFSDIEAGSYFDSVIDSACRQLSPVTWGNLFIDGILSLIAHMLELGRSGRAGSSGPLKREKVDVLEREYAVSASGSSIDGTSYGSEFERLKRMLATRPILC